MQLAIRSDEGVVTLGKRGVGKTNLIRFLLSNLPYKFWILDAVGNYRDFSDDSQYHYFLVNPHDERAVDSVLRQFKNQSDAMLVVDEGDRYEYGTIKKTPLSDEVNLGRNYGRGYIASARRTADIPKDFLSNADWVFIFRHDYPADLEVLRGWFGYPDEFWRDLPKFQFHIFYKGEYVADGVVDGEY